MSNRIKLVSAGAFCALLAAGGIAMSTAPASAQEVDEITVMGGLGPDGRPTTLSRVVSYRDLDLTTLYGQDELRHRIREAARDLCRDLGEPSRVSPSTLTPSCRTEAERDAFAQMRFAVAGAVPRGPDWAAPNELADLDPPATVAELPPPPPSAEEYAEPASATTRLITNGAVPDTPENRAQYGDPMSRAGQMTSPAGN